MKRVVEMWTRMIKNNIKIFVKADQGQKRSKSRSDQRQ